MSKEDQKTVSYTSEEKTVIITILVALVIMSALVVNLVLLTPAKTEEFSVIYMLDANKQTENYPKTVILGTNSTFTMWIGVENQNDQTSVYSVQVKIDDGTPEVNPGSVEAKYTFEKSLSNGELWEFPVIIELDQLGHNRIMFELWYVNAENLLVYTENWVTLSVDATESQPF
ncbi:MAG: DUF1616 domain-containing protein [Candidatus Bathyarchaeia archaeon]|jgi:uncharacterized membrane protein